MLKMTKMFHGAYFFVAKQNEAASLRALVRAQLEVPMTCSSTNDPNGLLYDLTHFTNTNILKAYELYANMAPELATQQFEWMRDAERDLYKTAIVTLAEGAKLRTVFITKKPVVDQIKWLKKVLSSKRNEMVAEHLLQAWFMKGQQELLVTFCDAMEIKHDGTGAVDQELPDELDADKLAEAVNQLFAKFPANLASLYLYVFNIQTHTGWNNLSKVLAEDSRIALS